MAGQAPITPGLSLTLDCLRFTAALLVLFGHATGGWLTGGRFWQLGGYHHAAVFVFFVLSGYVIAATTNPAAGMRRYVAARLARLYSVIAPALMLTILLDSLGQVLNPTFYLSTLPEKSSGLNVTQDLALRYALSALMIQEWWIFNLPVRSPGTNGPFWSMTYEVTYYLAFAVLVFMRGWRRIAILVILFALAGPAILILWPLWLAGAAAWYAREFVSRIWAVPFALAGAIAFVAFAVWHGPIEHADETLKAITGVRLLTAGVVGLATVALIVGGSRIVENWKVRSLHRTVRVVADHTFQLYLLHIPVVFFAVAVIPLPPGGWMQVSLVYAAVALAVCLTARITPPLKVAIQSWLLAALRTPPASRQVGAP